MADTQDTGADDLIPPTNLEDAQVPDLDAPLESPREEKFQNPDPHPLTPGGRRFEQVYAKGKQTERELADERDKRIRLEAQLELLQKAPSTAKEEYTWDQLQPMVASGQITMAQAQAHRETVLRREITNEVTSVHKRETSAMTREQDLSNEIFGYVQSAPALQNREDPTRQKVDAEFDYLVDLHGHDANKMSSVERKTLELTALRTVLGPREQLTKRMTPMHETHQGIPGGRPLGNTNVNPDQKLLNALSPHEVAHYNRAIKHGHYPDGWKGVVAELKFQKPVRA